MMSLNFHGVSFFKSLIGRRFGRHSDALVSQHPPNFSHILNFLHTLTLNLKLTLILDLNSNLNITVTRALPALALRRHLHPSQCRINNGTRARDHTHYRAGTCTRARARIH